MNHNETDMNLSELRDERLQIQSTIQEREEDLHKLGLASLHFIWKMKKYKQAHK